MTKRIMVYLPKMQYAQIDKLVKKGYFKTYQDFIRTAIRNLLLEYEKVLKK